MLSKVMKYENKSMYRILLPLYIGLILTTLLNMLTLAFTEHVPDNKLGSILTVVLVTAYIVMIIGVGFATYIMIIVRFYKSCLGDEGYLTFTLPVKTSTHIWGRVLVSCLWTIISGIVVVVSVCMIMWRAFDGVSLLGLIRELWGFVQAAYAENGAGTFLLIFLIIAICAATLLAVPLSLYASASIGQLILPKHKVLGGFAGYFILSIISEIGTLVLLLPMMTSDLLYGIDGGFSTMAAANMFFGVTLVYTLIFNAAYYIITHLVLSRRLNLE